MAKIPEVMPFEAVGPGGRTHDCYWRRVSVRPPRKDEWYISGAIPMAYKARSDLTTSYIIVEPTHYAKLVTKHEKGDTIPVCRSRP